VTGTRVRVPVRRIGAGAAGDGPREQSDWVAVEAPLEIRVCFPGSDPAGENLLVTMRTPGHDADLARGLMFSEGLIGSAADLLEVNVADEGAGGRLLLVVPERLRERFSGAARNFYANSSCGICGRAALDALRARAPFEIADQALRFDAATLAGLPAALGAQQPGFTATGGLHAAAFFGPGGDIHAVREDVGRHNAVDKLIGAALREGRLPLAGQGLLVSGRASFEIVEKARMAGCPLVAAFGAASSLAIEAAWESGMTLIGFLRDGRCNVYAGPARVR